MLSGWGLQLTYVVLCTHLFRRKGNAEILLWDDMGVSGKGTNTDPKGHRDDEGIMKLLMKDYIGSMLASSTISFLRSLKIRIRIGQDASPEVIEKSFPESSKALM